VTKPVLLAVDDDTQVLAAVRRDLRSRYRESYTIIPGHGKTSRKRRASIIAARRGDVCIEIT